MTKNEKETIIKMLNDSIESYRIFRDRDDYLDIPCVKREIMIRQSQAFNLADCLCRYGFITWEQCCEYWAQVDIIGETENEECSFVNCEANVNGVCKYTMSE
jgi:hypothetical protein